MTKKLSLLMVGWLFFVLANYAGAQEAKETKVITYPAPVTEKVLSTYTESHLISTRRFRQSLKGGNIISPISILRGL